MENGQLDLLVIDLEDGCKHSTKSVKDSKRHLGTKLVNLDSVGAPAELTNFLGALRKAGELRKTGGC